MSADPPGRQARLARVFISHSGLTGLVGDLLDALERELSPANGFQVLVDRRDIVLGTPFADRVIGFIRDCDAAVILLSPRALDPQHTWVLTEAAQLAVRAAADADFQRVPVFLEGVTPADLRSTPWEPVRLSAASGVAGDDAGELAARIRAELEPTRSRVAASAVTRGLAAELRAIPARTLLDAAQALLGDAGFSAGEPAHAVASRLVSGPLTIQTAVEFVRGWLTAHPACAVRVLRAVLPYAWVDAQAAACIAPAVAAHRPIGLNTAEPRTSRAYVARASPSWPQWRTRDVVPNGDDIEAIRAAVIAELADAAGEDEVSELADLPAEEFDPADPLFLAVPCPCFDAEIVGAFADLPPGVVLVFLGGPVVYGAEQPPEGVAYVRPELEEASERATLADLNRVQRGIRRMLRDENIELPVPVVL